MTLPSDTEGRDPEDWPAWKVWLWQTALRARCLSLFHDFDDVDTVGGHYEPSWYCVRCLGPYERAADPPEQPPPRTRPHELLVYRLYSWWHSWAWRFER